MKAKIFILFLITILLLSACATPVERIQYDSVSATERYVLQESSNLNIFCDVFPVNDMLGFYQNTDDYPNHAYCYIFDNGDANMLKYEDSVIHTASEFNDHIVLSRSPNDGTPNSVIEIFDSDMVLQNSYQISHFVSSLLPYNENIIVIGNDEYSVIAEVLNTDSGQTNQFEIPNLLMTAAQVQNHTLIIGGIYAAPDYTGDKKGKIVFWDLEHGTIVKEFMLNDYLPLCMKNTSENVYLAAMHIGNDAHRLYRIDPEELKIHTLLTHTNDQIWTLADWIVDDTEIYLVEIEKGSETWITPNIAVLYHFDDGKLISEHSWPLLSRGDFLCGQCDNNDFTIYLTNGTNLESFQIQYPEDTYR